MPVLFAAYQSERGLVSEFVIPKPDDADSCTMLLRPGVPVQVASRISHITASGGYERNGENVTPRVAVQLDIGDLTLIFTSRIADGDVRIHNVQYDSNGEWIDVSFRNGNLRRVPVDRLYEFAMKEGYTP